MATDSSVFNEPMDDEKSSISEEEGQQQSEKHGLASSMTLFVCFHFIMMSAVIASVQKHIGIYLEEVFKIILTNNTILDKETVHLQEFANKFCLNLYICIIDQNGKTFRHLNSTTIHESQHRHRAFLVFDQRNQIFYPFYVCDNKHKNHTTFSMDDTYTLRLFEDCIQSYNWSDQLETTQQSSEQNTTALNQQNNEVENASTANINCNIGNGNNQSNDKLKASALCSLLVEQVQNCITCVGPQLDSLNFSFKSSDYRLRDNDLSSPAAASEALNIQLQLLLKLADLAAESLKTNCVTKKRETQTSMETNETDTVRNASLNNHDQDALPGIQSGFDPAIPFNSLSTTLTNNDRPPVTTNDFNEAINLPKLGLLNQPKRFWHNRELRTLGKGCPAIQVEGSGQQTSLEFKLPMEIRHFKQEFYLGADSVTYDKNVHDQKLIVPINASLKEECNPKTNDLNCILFPNDDNNIGTFNPMTKGVFSKIDPDEVESLRKTLPLMMVNFYQGGHINKDLIEKKKLIWCRLMFAIYIKLPNGQFERVSPPIYSDLIKETRRSQSIDTSNVFPQEFCERGGQMIFIPLNASIEKHNLHVSCNDRDLNQNEFQIAEKLLSFESPACVQDRTHLHIIINTRNNYGWILLQEYKLQYRPHDKHSDPCGVVNED